ncbi:hypothetical protein A9Z07_13470 [Acinetobacter sp. YK3]|nr:hypothetical protein A9Z07_13470 [Acinetobacter sp. YK3]
MLVYGTLSIFKGANVADISAFGSLLSGIGAFFSGFVAIFIFYGWKHQYNKTVEKELALEVIQNFVRADNSLAKVKEGFYFFKLKFDKIYELHENDFNNLDKDLREILSELNAANFDLGTYFESLRKYSVVAEKPYYNDYKAQVSELKIKIFNLQESPISLPSFVSHLELSLEEIIKIFIELEDKNINTLLKELKAIN